MVQFRGFQVHIWGVSVHFIWFLSAVFWEFFYYPPGVSGVWDPRQGVRCILRTANRPPPPQLYAQVCL